MKNQQLLIEEKTKREVELAAEIKRIQFEKEQEDKKV